MSNKVPRSFPLFIVFEGGEGSGKSTQVRLLADAFKRSGSIVTQTREPGGSPLGVQIRSMLLHNPDPVSSEAELLLYAADRAQHIKEVVRPALDRGEIVISDRHKYSTVAYQGYGRGIYLGTIDKLNDIACAGLVPHVIFWLKLDPEVGLKRARKRSATDRLEAEALAFHQAVYQGFEQMAQVIPGFAVIDAALTPEAVHAQILEVLQDRYGPYGLNL